MTERFAEVAGRNFTKLEVTIAKMFVLEFRKVAPFLHKGPWQTGRCQNGLMRVVLASNI